MIYEIRSKKYLSDLIFMKMLKKDWNYLETEGMITCLKTVLEQAVDTKNTFITDGYMKKLGDYEYHYEKFDKLISINFDDKHTFLMEGYFVDKRGRVILNIVNQDVVVVLDVTIPYYSNSSFIIYDNVIRLDKLRLDYINEIMYS